MLSNTAVVVADREESILALEYENTEKAFSLIGIPPAVWIKELEGKEAWSQYAAANHIWRHFAGFVNLSKGPMVEKLLKEGHIQKESLPSFYSRIMDYMVEIVLQRMRSKEDDAHFTPYALFISPRDYPKPEFVPYILSGYETYIERVRDLDCGIKVYTGKLVHDTADLYALCCYGILGYPRNEPFDLADPTVQLLQASEARALKLQDEVIKMQEIRRVRDEIMEVQKAVKSTQVF